MLCEWLNRRGFPQAGAPKQNNYLYSIRLQKNIQEKRPALVNRRNAILLHDKAKPHRENKNYEDKILELGRSVLAYCSDLAPIDYHLFPPLQNLFAGKNFANDAGTLLQNVPF